MRIGKTIRGRVVHGVVVLQFEYFTFCGWRLDPEFKINDDSAIVKKGKLRNVTCKACRRVMGLTP